MARLSTAFALVFFISLLLSGHAVQSQDKVAEPSAPLWKTLPVLPRMPAPDESGFASVNDVKIYFAIYNKKAADPVLLLHGGMGSSSYWAAEIPLLSKTHRVIVIDSRGHGHSSISDQPFSYALMASDILKTLDKINIPRTAIVGWSDGGIIGLILAMENPDRVSRLFTYGTNFNEAGYKTGPPDTAAGRKFRQQAEADYRRLSPTPDSFPRLRKMLFRMYDTEPNLDTAKLKTIQIPALIVYGRYEQFIKQEHFQQLAGLIPHAGLLMLPDVSHGGPLQDPESFHRAIMYWLGESSGDSTLKQSRPR